MSTISNSPRIKEIASIVGDAAPHSMSELYGVNFTSGNSSVNGPISLSQFRNNTTLSAEVKETKNTSRDPTVLRISSDGSTFVLGIGSTSTPSAYVFEKINGEWVETAILSGNPTGSYIFGESVAVSGDGSVVAIGSPTYERAVYVFERPSSGWVSTSTYSKKFTYTRAAGESVSISDNSSFLLVGYPGLSSPFADAGGAYVYEKVGTNWIQRAILSSNTGVNNDHIGESCFISGNGSTVILGGYYNDTYKGLAYIYEKPSTGWTNTDQYAIKLTGSGSRVYFGTSCCLSYDGLTAIVGAYRQDSDQGAAHIYEKINGTWSYRAKLTGEYFSPRSRFGRSVYLTSDGTHAIVGAPEADNSTGRVYIFEKPATGWVSTSTYKNELSNNSVIFLGHDVSIAADKSKLLVGNDNRYGVDYFHIYENLYFIKRWEAAYRLTGSLTDTDLGTYVEISGDGNTCVVGYLQVLDGSSYVNGIIVYTKINGSWDSGTTITNTDSVFGLYCASLSHDGNVLAVGAPTHPGGSAYIYTRSSGTWNSGIQITPSAGGDLFGSSVSVSGDGNKIAVGSTGSDSSAGRVYVFGYINSVWTEEAILTPNFSSSGSSTDYAFGTSVSMSYYGNILAVGAPGGPYNSVNTGAAFVFEHSGTLWNSGTEIGISGLNDGCNFGRDVCISSDGYSLIVGVPSRNTNNIVLAGSAYVFKYSLPFTSWGTGTELLPSSSAQSDEFGSSVYINYDGSVVVIGAPTVYPSTSGGYGYIFRNLNNLLGDYYWDSGTKVLEPGPINSSRFGRGVTISENNVIAIAGLNGQVYTYEPKSD